MQAKIPSVGLEKGRNYALDLTDSALIFFLNDQVIVRRGAMRSGNFLNEKARLLTSLFYRFQTPDFFNRINRECTSPFHFPGQLLGIGGDLRLDCRRRAPTDQIPESADQMAGWKF